MLVGDEEIAHGEITVDAGRTLTIRLEFLLGEPPEPGDEIVLHTVEAAGRREYVVTVDSCTPLKLVVSDIELLSTFQQRSAIRVACDLSISIRYEMDGTARRDLETPIQATIVDLSSTGLRLHCRQPLDQGYQFGFQLGLRGDAVEIVAQVLRHQEVPRGFLHGCRFVGTTEREADTLQRVVLGEQIFQRHRAAR